MLFDLLRLLSSRAGELHQSFTTRSDLALSYRLSPFLLEYPIVFRDSQDVGSDLLGSIMNVDNKIFRIHSKSFSNEGESSP